MKTIHDKLNENFCIPNKPSAFHPQPTQWKREHFPRGGTTQNKVSQRWRVGLRNRFVSAYLAASGAHRKASDQASVIVRLCKVPFRKR